LTQSHVIFLSLSLILLYSSHLHPLTHQSKSDSHKKSEEERYKTLELSLSKATQKAKKEIKRLSDLSQGQEALVAALESEKGDLLAQIEIGVKRAEKDLGAIRKLEQQLNTSRAANKKLKLENDNQKKLMTQTERNLKKQTANLELERREQRKETSKLRRALDELKESFKSAQVKAAQQISAFNERLHKANQQRDAEKQRREEIALEMKEKEEIVTSATVEVDKWRKKLAALENKAAEEEKRLRQKIKDVGIEKVAIQQELFDHQEESKRMQQEHEENARALAAHAQRVHLLERQLAKSAASTASLEERLETAEAAKIERDQISKELESLRVVMQQERASREAAEELAQVNAQNASMEIQRLQKEINRKEASNKSLIESSNKTEKRLMDLQASSKLTISELKANIRMFFSFVFWIVHFSLYFSFICSHTTQH